MSTDENGHAGSGGSDSASAGSGSSSDRAHAGERAGDPLREILLAFVDQIDALAGWLATADRGAAPTGASATGASSATFVRDGLGADVVGEITTLMREIGDLVARLIAALITVLEAIVAALRTAPADAGPQPRRYQPIAVRLEAHPPAPDTSGPTAPSPEDKACPPGFAHHPPENEK